MSRLRRSFDTDWYPALAGWAKLCRADGAQVRRRSAPLQRRSHKATAAKTDCGGEVVSGARTLLAVRYIAL